MQELSALKELKRPGTPLFLFACRLKTSETFYWSTHSVEVDGHQYDGRVLDHSPIEYRMNTGDESGFVPRVSFRLANADHAISGIAAQQLWKGAELTIRFVIYDLMEGQAACESRLLLRGTVNAPDEIDHESVKLSVINRLSAYRSHLPTQRIQKRCPWVFPRSSADRAQACNGGTGSQYGAFFGCGYSPDINGGVGNYDGSEVYTDCDFTKADCVSRGMYDQDSLLRSTRRFAGSQFVPIERLVRGFGDRGFSTSTPQSVDANGTVLLPLVYGTVWSEGIVSISVFDGNLRRMEVLLCSGRIAAVVKVIVDGYEIPVSEDGRDMSATGWYNIVSLGDRTGSFNLDFTDETGNPAGDPNGGIAVLSVVVPASGNTNTALPRVQVLLQGLHVPIYDSVGAYIADAFTSNPAWVLLDVLRRSGYQETELDISSFAEAAAVCAQISTTVDSLGNEITGARSECNVVFRTRRPVADILRGIQLGSEISLRYNSDGLLSAFVEDRIANQHPELPYGSNATESLYGGWPAYEFGDGSSGADGIAISGKGVPSLRLSSRSHAETANRVTVAFIDAINDYTVDSYSLVDVDDIVNAGQEISKSLPAIGVTGQSQAFRLCKKFLAKNIQGNLYAEFESSIKVLLLRPGDIITINVPSIGLLRRLFRVLSIAPGLNGERVKIVAQAHSDEWYGATLSESFTLGSSSGSDYGNEPRPLLGDLVDAFGEPTYSMKEEVIEETDGTQRVKLCAGFAVPNAWTSLPHQTPQLSTFAQVLASGGNLSGPANLYYAITVQDGAGRESSLSTTVHAYVPSGSSNAGVQLTGIRNVPGAVSLNVYRGRDPLVLRRIAEGVAIDSTFFDPGLGLTALGPPDPKFVKARFEWRSEYLPPLSISSASDRTIVVSGATMVPATLSGKILRIQSGTGVSQERVIETNTETEITITTKWKVLPDTSSTVCAVEAGWTPGGESATSPVSFVVPNQSGSVIHVRGYAVGESGSQSRKELSSICRHVIDGASGSGQDTDVPPAPTYGISTRDGGYLEVGGIGFGSLANLSTITSGTLHVYYLSELDAAPFGALGSELTDVSDQLQFQVETQASPGVLLKVDDELLRIVEFGPGDLECTVERSVYGSNAQTHSLGTPVYKLERKVATIPIPRQFFGSPASGDYSFSIPLANTRVLASDLLFTNSKGNSEATSANFLGLVGGGLRVLGGGQISFQVGGYLGIQTPAAPAFVVEESRAVRDIFAIVDEAPTGSSLVLRINRNATELCSLTIPPGGTISEIISGTSIAALMSMDRLSLDIVSVGQGGSSTPGRNLSVVIRL